MRTALTVSSLLRVAIKEDSRTPQQIAAAAGINYTVLWRFLYRRKQITSDTLDKLAKVIDATLALHYENE